jgi:hypothetical protein
MERLAVVGYNIGILDKVKNLKAFTCPSISIKPLIH